MQRGSLIVLALVAAALFILALARIVNEKPSDVSFERQVPDKDSFEEITVDISIGKERGTFSNLVLCGRRDLPNSTGVIARYGQTGGAVVGAFPSKKGFILDIGDVCDEVRLLKSIHPWVSEEGTWPGGYPMPRDPKLEMLSPEIGSSRWRLYVFDDVTAPMQGQLFIGPDYFWTGDANIQVHSITTRRPAKGEKDEWRKRWANGGNYFGWLTDLYNQPGGKDVYFSFIFYSSRHRGDLFSEQIAEARKLPELTDRRWLVFEGGPNFGSFKGRKLYAVEQWPGRVNFASKGPHSLWTTRVYLNRVPNGAPRRPGGLVSCSPVSALEGQAEAEVFIEGADTGVTVAELPYDKDRRRYRMNIIDTQKQLWFTLDTGQLGCLNPGLILGHWER